MPAGRPIKIKSVQELRQMLEKYFKDCDDRVRVVKITKDGDLITAPDPRPYTISGMALALGVDRKTILNYESNDEFFPTIKWAKAKCENYAEESLWTSSPAGIIFNLVNNYSWKNQQHHKLGGDEDAPPIAQKTECTISSEDMDLFTKVLTDIERQKAIDSIKPQICCESDENTDTKRS